MPNDVLKDRFKKNVYLKPDEYLNGWARKCGWKATLVYDSLWRHADREGRSFPSIKLMAEEHGVSEDTIMRGLKTLIEFNLVKKEGKRDTKGRFIHNVYTLTDKNEWRDPKSSTAPTGRWQTPPQSIPPTARWKKTPSSIPPTADTQTADSDYKVTHIKGTHNINNSKELLTQAKPVEKPQLKKQYGNPDINFLISYLKEKLNLPMLDGSEKQNRRYAYLLLKKFKEVDKIKLLIDVASKDKFWSTTIASFRQLYYNAVQIISKTRKRDNITEIKI